MPGTIPQLIVAATDLLAAFLFLYGLKRMSSPVTAPSGIFVAGLGMAVAILASFRATSSGGCSTVAASPRSPISWRRHASANPESWFRPWPQ